MKKVLLIAPVLSRSGYGEMGRFAMRSMAMNPNIDLYIHNINWGKTSWIWKDDDERRMIDSLLQNTLMDIASILFHSVRQFLKIEFLKIAPIGEI